MWRMKDVFTKAALCFFSLLVCVGVACTFAPAKFALLNSRAQTATYTSHGYHVFLQRADLPAPGGLVRGRALTFSRDAFTAQELLVYFGAKAIACEQAEGVTLYHAYAPDLSESETLACGKVNLQIAVGETYVAVASPVFYGSF